MDKKNHLIASASGMDQTWIASSAGRDPNFGRLLQYWQGSAQSKSKHANVIRPGEPHPAR